ncbi:MAG TPA: lytic transglycosylase domain-containing protein [Xanthobacteraceae bacterium]
MRAPAWTSWLFALCLAGPIISAPAEESSGPSPGAAPPTVTRSAEPDSSAQRPVPIGPMPGAAKPQSPAPGEPPSRESICLAVQSAAAANELPVEFFTRLIWQESRFDPRAVSRKGAQGVAQFMPKTALWRGLADPFDPIQALPQSAAFLRELRAQFGNLGLAAAAYNAGPGRVQAWLAGQASLPGETRAYVMAITGYPAEAWRAGEPHEKVVLPAVPCPQVAKLFTPSKPVVPAGPKPPAWGIQLAGNWSEARALASYDSLQKQYPAILGGHPPLLIHSKIAGRGPAVWTRIRVGADTREGAERLCSNLKSAGGSCIVLRN